MPTIVRPPKIAGLIRQHTDAEIAQPLGEPVGDIDGGYSEGRNRDCRTPRPRPKRAGGSDSKTRRATSSTFSPPPTQLMKSPVTDDPVGIERGDAFERIDEKIPDRRSLTCVSLT